MLDADKFKLFNDTYGHINGDLCLKYIAERLLDIPDPENGYSIRYGGEEFAVLLPFTKIEEAALVGERLRKAVEDYPIAISAGATFVRVGTELVTEI